MVALSVQPLKIWSKQSWFRTNEAWLRAFVSGRGAGKTRILMQDAILSAVPGELHMVVGPSYPTLEDGSWRTFKELAEQLGILGRVNESKPYRAKIRVRGGWADFVFRTAEKPDLLRAPSLPLVAMEEAALCRKAAYDVIVGSLRYRGKMGRLTMAFNPKGKRNWTYGVLFDEDGNPRPNTYCVKAASWENPFLPAEYSDLVGSQYSERLRAQELGGEFVDIEGLMFDALNFKRVSVVPREARRVRYWDKAGSTAEEGSRSFSVGVLMAEAAGQYYVEDVVRGQWSYLQRNENMLTTAKRDAARFANTVQIYVEQEGGSGGKESMQQTIKLLAEFPVRRDVVSGVRHRVAHGEKVAGAAKIVRAQPYAAQVEAGNVNVLSARWTDDFIEEHAVFPESSIMDQVDASSGAYAKLASGAGVVTGGFTRVDRRRANPKDYGIQAVLPRRRDR